MALQVVRVHALYEHRFQYRRRRTKPGSDVCMTLLCWA